MDDEDFLYGDDEDEVEDTILTLPVGTNGK